MALKTDQPPIWGTPIFGSVGVFPGLDSTGLADHLRVCTPSNVRWLRVHWAAEVVHGFFAARVVTTGLLLVIVMASAIAAL